jgi:hypothetical protein
MAWDIFHKNKRRLLMIGTVFWVAGCGGPPMSNEKIIAASNQCKTAGLVAREFYNSAGEVAGIQCGQPIYH